MSASFAFVELKSFGDLVISAAALRLLAQSDLERCRLVIGPYLQELCHSLNPSCKVEVLTIPDRTVPALFDMKKRGIAKSIRSALCLRSALSRAAPGLTLVMECQAWRERFISGTRSCLVPPRKDNVYLAFEAFMAANFQLSVSVPARDESGGTRVALCPFSRVRAKNLSTALIVALAQQCEQAGFEPELLLLEGEHVQHPGILSSRVIPRRFDALADALAGYDAVISADSLPAHLAEYCGTPIFVASPVHNCYWLPKSAFIGGHWGLIPERANLMLRLQRFLNTTRP